MMKRLLILVFIVFTAISCSVKRDSRKVSYGVMDKTTIAQASPETVSIAASVNKSEKSDLVESLNLLGAILIIVAMFAVLCSALLWRLIWILMSGLKITLGCTLLLLPLLVYWW